MLFCFNAPTQAPIITVSQPLHTYARTISVASDHYTLHPNATKHHQRLLPATVNHQLSSHALAALWRQQLFLDDYDDPAVVGARLVPVSCECHSQSCQDFCPVLLGALGRGAGVFCCRL